MIPSQLIVIGGSAGSIPSILEIARQLPPNFSVPICVVVHFHPEARSVLPSLLESASGLRCKHPQTQEMIMPRHIYVAPPDRHMVIHQNRILLHRGALENRSRPAIDPLFRSAALSLGSRVTAVLLSGYLDDGTAGLVAVKKEGGRVIIQDPNDTPFGDMPAHALEFVQPDCVLPLSHITPALLEMLQRFRPAPIRQAAEAEERDQSVALNVPLLFRNRSKLVCPQCKGALWEIADEAPFRFRCPDGHVHSPYSLLACQDEALESALWSALRALDEKVSLNKRLLQRAEELGQYFAIRKYQHEIEATSQHCLQIRQILQLCPGHEPPADEKPVHDS